MIESLASDTTDTLRIVRPDWSVSPMIRVFTTTRLGGVSQPPFDTLNLGLHVGDDPAAVWQNRNHLTAAAALPAEPCWLNQTHGTRIVRLSAEAAGLGAADGCSGMSSGDGAWTNQPGCVLSVLTADCLPVVIARTDGRELAVVHAGWRGLAAGILENALAAFDSTAELHAWLGPAIGPDAFEVGEEVRQAFVDRHAENTDCFRPGRGVDTPSPDGRARYWADIYALARGALQRCRAITVTGGEYCTVSQPQWFHSHRRDGADSGRMVTLAWIDASQA